MIFKDTRTHTCKSSGHFRAQGGEAGSWTCFRKLCTSSPSIAYNMRHYVMNTRMHACTHRCAHRLPTFDRTVHFSILHYEVVERTRARLNANISSPPEFDQNSVGEELGEQVENFEESIRKAGFELAKGSHSSRHCLKKKGDEGGEAIENLESTQQWLFVRLTRPSLETIPREPYTTSPSSSSLHRDQASERQSACPGVSLYIRHMHNFFFLLPLLLFPSLFFFFFIIVHLGQPFRRQFRLFFKDVHHFSGRVKSHSTTSYPSLSLRGWKADLNFLIEESALFENSLVSLSTDFFGFFLFLFPFSRRPEYLFHGDIDFSPVIRYNYLFRRFEKRFLS